MHAVVIRVTIAVDGETATAELREHVVPRVSQAPGFVAGYWTRKDNSGLSMVVFESEDAANAASEQIPSVVPDSVTLESVEVREVVANA
jgi:heme-degrading monooxygenase HmoA